MWSCSRACPTCTHDGSSHGALVVDPAVGSSTCHHWRTGRARSASWGTRPPPPRREKPTQAPQASRPSCAGLECKNTKIQLTKYKIVQRQLEDPSAKIEACSCGSASETEGRTWYASLMTLDLDPFRISSVSRVVRAWAGGVHWRTLAFATGAYILVGPGVHLCWIALPPEARAVYQCIL